MVMKKITMLFVTALSLFFTALFAQQEYLDDTFGSNGIIFQNYTDTLTGANFESEFKTIVFQPDGKFITGSNFHQHGPNQRYIINQYNSDGTLNPAFGTNGFIESNVDNSIGAVQLQSDGKIIASSVEGNYDSSFSYLIRYNADGSVDNSFGVNGTVMDTVNTIKSFSIRLNDKIVVAKMPDYVGFSPNFKIERYSADGQLDVGFGTNGTVEFSLVQSKISVQHLVIQDDGKMMICGLVRSDDVDDYSSNIILLRFDDDGSLDSTFGDAGIKVFDYSYNDYFYDLLIQPDGKLIFSSSSHAVESINRIMRLNVDGSLDRTFGNGGITTIDYPILRVFSIKQLPNGKLIVAGIYETSVNPSPSDNPTPTAVMIGCYDTNGYLDLDFGQNGYIITAIENHRVLDDKLAIQSDGKILVGATFSNAWFSTHPRAAVLRYNPDQNLSIPQFNNKSTFLLYPNPVGETVTIDFTLKQSEELSIDLYGNDGRKIVNLLKNQEFQSGFNSRKLEMPDNLSRGIYFLTISNGTNTVNIKIVK
ncbi:hypothetical protein FSS13T_20740 [Flavobacterium saliperosum S13]|nr:hypothetical protein FSS13T_20740 [Flavobacterium saliperosum S13]